VSALADCYVKLEEASTHKSAKHTGNVFVPLDLDLRPFDPQINGFLGLVVKQFFVTFGDPSCIGFRDILCKNKQTNRQTHKRC